MFLTYVIQHLNTGEMRETIAYAWDNYLCGGVQRLKHNAWTFRRMRETCQPCYLNCLIVQIYKKNSFRVWDVARCIINQGSLHKCISIIFIDELEWHRDSDFTIHWGLALAPRQEYPQTILAMVLKNSSCDFKNTGKWGKKNIRVQLL